MTTPPAILTVTRHQPDDLGMRQIILSLDGAPWTTLAAGQIVTRELPPGTHELRADNTLVRKTATFSIAAGETVQFSVSNRAGFGTWLFMFLGAPILYLTLTQERPEATPPASAS